MIQLELPISEAVLVKMGDKLNREYFEPGTAAFNYNNVTGGADSASGGSGGSGMDCLPMRTPPEPFHYLISEQAKSLVALQELQNEVGALLEFRDLVIETFPNLRSKMPPSTPANSARRDWEPGVRVRRKLAAGTDSARTKPQPSVQDSGFSTETSCGKDAHSSASASASASRSRPVEDELWALLDVIQRKGSRLRDEAEQLRSEIDVSGTAEESFARALQACDCGDLQTLREERDALLARAAELEAAAAASPAPRAPPAPLGRLDSVLDTPPRAPRVPSPDAKKFAAILLESNPVELQRQLLTSTVTNQVLCERLRRAAEHRTLLLERLEKERDLTDDLKFRLEEKSIELEGARALVRQLETRGGSPAPGAGGVRARSPHSSMRDMEPLALPSAGAGGGGELSDTPRRRPSRIPLHTAHKGAAPRPPVPAPPSRPPSAHSARSAASGRRSAVPVRRDPPPDHKRVEGESEEFARAAALVAEYVARASRLAPLLPRLRAAAPPACRPLPRELAPPAPHTPPAPRSLARELRDSLWDDRPRRYFESMHYADGDRDSDHDQYDSDSLAP